MEDPIWANLTEGQLAVDVAETPEAILIRAVVAGVPDNELDIHVTEDAVTIRGTRQAPDWGQNATLHFAEVFFGPFSRTVILPAAVKPDQTEATIQNGILTLRAPKAQKSVRLNVQYG